MTNFDFADELRTNTFSSNNNYIYGGLTNTNLRFFKDCPNYPYIMTTSYQRDPTVLMYSNVCHQLRNRLLNTAKIKEVMDSSPVPLLFKIKEKHYLIGKGFLGHMITTYEFSDSFNLLFVACIDQTNPPKSIEDVRFFVSRDIYKDDYKAVMPAIRDTMVAHPGDVILTSNMNKRIGDKIPFPAGGSLGDRQQYKENVMLECIRDVFS